MSQWLTACMLVAGIAIILGSLSVSATSDSLAEEPGASANSAITLPVEVTRVRRQSSYEVTDHHAGRVVAARESALGFERAGRVVSVAVEPGDHVEAGQLLARLDSREIEAAKRERLAERRRLEARVALARKTSDRRTELYEAGVLPAQQLDEATLGLAQERATWAANEAAIDTLDVRLALSDIVAPFAGTVVERAVDEGTIIAPGQVVLRLVDERREVHLGVPPAVAERLRTGQLAKGIWTEGEVELELAAIIPEIEASTRTLRLVFRLSPRHAARLHPGELVRLALPHRIDTAGFWLPVSALTEGRRGLWSAYAAVPERLAGQSIRDDDPEASELHRLELRALDLIHTTAERAFVRGTLSDGDRVVVEGVHRLVPEQLVRVVASAPDEAALRTDRISMSAEPSDVADVRVRAQD